VSVGRFALLASVSVVAPLAAAAASVVLTLLPGMKVIVAISKAHKKSRLEGRPSVADENLS
jgi:threonine/homoserine/homoserine lactone efflux protein